MADIKEEQLLSDLLRDLAAADAQTDAADAGLEARVMAAWDQKVRHGSTRVSPATWKGVSAIVCAAAAAVAIAVWLPASQPAQPVDPPAPRLPIARSPAVAPESRSTAAVEQPAGTAPLPARGTFTPRRRAEAAYAAPAAQGPMEFVPLMPMTGHELRGSFQIVRVQMPRASLGALASPLEHPDGLVEADVLLGEDGMARAIRISSPESIYPRRSR
jgi:hypothetical protein